MKEEILKALRVSSKPLQLRVNPYVGTLTKPGEALALMESGVVVFYFRSESELDVWLDAAREQGLRDDDFVRAVTPMKTPAV